MTLEEWMKDWITIHSSEVRVRTTESYMDLNSRFIVSTIGQKELDDLTSGDVMHLLAGVVAAGHSRTAELIWVLLSAALKDVKPDVMLHVKRPVHVQVSPEPWTDEQMAEYRAGLVGHKHELPLSLALILGLRRGEICGLRWSDIDLTNLTLRIVNQKITLADGSVIDGPPKSRAGQRLLPLPSELVPLVKDKMQIGGFVCSVAPHGLDKAHRTLVKRLGLPPIPLHGLRHSMATAYVRHGGDLRTLQQILGHASFATTADRYTHPDLAMMRQAVDTVSHVCYNDVGGTFQRYRYQVVPLTLNQGAQGSSP